MHSAFDTTQDIEFWQK